MDIEILNENQKNLDSFKNAIMQFVNPKILDEQMRDLAILDQNVNEANSQNKEVRARIKDEAEQEMRDEYLAFLKRYEKCYNRIQSFSQKLAQNTISKQLDACKELLTKNFETKANFGAQTYMLGVGNFNADIHSKTILVEEKYQKGTINADTALDHIGKLQNCYIESSFSSNDEDLKNLIGAYRADYAKKAIFKNETGAYDSENILSETTVQLCKSENAENSELQALMSEAAKIIVAFNEKLNVANINNMLIDARQFVASFGHPDWDERRATRFMDKFERQCADLEKMESEILLCQTKLDDLISKIKDKQKQAEEANKQVAKIETKKRLRALNENIDKVNALMKKRTPCSFLNEHLRVLNNDYENVKIALGPDVSEEISKILALTKTRLEELGTSVHQTESLQEKTELGEENLLEVKIDFEDEKPKK